MKHIKGNEWQIHTQGLSDDKIMSVDLDTCKCGDIKNGIALDIKGFGAWIISRDEIKHLAQELGFLSKDE